MSTRLKTLRETAGMTQKEAALQIGVVQSAVSMWETGESFPRTELLHKIAKIYGCGIADLFESEQEETQCRH